MVEDDVVEEVVVADETREAVVEDGVEEVAVVGAGVVGEAAVEETVEEVAVGDKVVEVAVECVFVAGVPSPFVYFLPWGLVLGDGQGHVHIHVVGCFVVVVR